MVVNVKKRIRHLFDAILCNDAERVQKTLEAHPAFTNGKHYVDYGTHGAQLESENGSNDDDSDEDDDSNDGGNSSSEDERERNAFDFDAHSDLSDDEDEVFRARDRFGEGVTTDTEDEDGTNDESNELDNDLISPMWKFCSDGKNGESYFDLPILMSAVRNLFDNNGDESSTKILLLFIKHGADATKSIPACFLTNLDKHFTLPFEGNSRDLAKALQAQSSNEVTTVAMDRCIHLLESSALLNGYDINDDVEEVRKSTVTNWGNLLQNTEHCDVAIECKGGQKVMAHKCVLAESSPYFKGLFSGAFKDSKGKVKTDSKPVMVKALLKFLYTGVCEQEFIDAERNAAEMLVMSHFYNIQPLQTLASQSLVRTLSAENVKERLILAHQHEDKIVKAAGFTFICRNPTILFEVVSLKADDAVLWGELKEALGDWNMMDKDNEEKKVKGRPNKKRKM